MVGAFQFGSRDESTKTIYATNEVGQRESTHFHGYHPSSAVKVRIPGGIF